MRYGRSGRRAGQCEATAIPDGSTEAAHSRQDGIALGHPIGEIALFAKMISPRSLPTRPVTWQAKESSASQAGSSRHPATYLPRIHPAESINQFS
jgi:hypothetical protein